MSALRICAPLLAKASAATHPRRLLGLEFPNPVGVAAGLDKDLESIGALSALGFGFVEVGTVTLRPQAGNPRPRLFRLPKSEALINRMGFNNRGAREAGRRLERLRENGHRGIVGVNIGVNKDTPEARVADDIAATLEAVAPCADYITLNVSSPNTPGLRDWQQAPRLARLLERLARTRSRLDRSPPLAVKLSPDLSNIELPDLVDALIDGGADALIAVNTTTARPAMPSQPHADEQGGLSGRPLAPQALAMARRLVELLDARAPLIACGGIHDAASARARMEAGAQLLQLYTGLIYRGPGLLDEILRDLPQAEAP